MRSTLGVGEVLFVRRRSAAHAHASFTQSIQFCIKVFILITYYIYSDCRTVYTNPRCFIRASSSFRLCTDPASVSRSNIYPRPFERCHLLLKISLPSLRLALEPTRPETVIDFFYNFLVTSSSFSYPRAEDL